MKLITWDKQNISNKLRKNYSANTMEDINSKFIKHSSSSAIKNTTTAEFKSSFHQIKHGTIQAGISHAKPDRKNWNEKHEKFSWHRIRKYIFLKCRLWQWLVIKIGSREDKNTKQPAARHAVQDRKWLVTRGYKRVEEL